MTAETALVKQRVDSCLPELCQMATHSFKEG